MPDQLPKAQVTIKLDAATYAAGKPVYGVKYEFGESFFTQGYTSVETLCADVACFLDAPAFNMLTKADHTATYTEDD